MKLLPVNARPPVEKLCHESDVVLNGPAVDVSRTDQGGKSDIFCPRDYQTGAAELRPLGVFVRPMALVEVEVVVQLLL